MEPIDRYDQVQHFWCPMLGQPLNFGYCRRMRQGLPCHRVIACYQPHFEVQAFLEQHYSAEERRRFLAPPPGRLDRVAQAVKNVQGRGEDES